MVDLACWINCESFSAVWNRYIGKFPKILKLLKLDAEAVINCDPATQLIEEVYMAYPGFYAIAIYRLAHELFQEGLPLVPRLMTEYAHHKTGVDLHPGAQVGKSFFIDHRLNNNVIFRFSNNAKKS